MLLLTGAAGFIGSNVLAELNRRDRTDVICVDNLADGRKFRNILGKRFVDYIDSCDLFKQRLPRLDGIIHLGAESSTGATNAREVIDNNFTYTKKIFELAVAHHCPVVYASSASVYGDGIRGFRETPECDNPQSLYAMSKWLIDQYVRHAIDYRNNHEIDVINVPIVGLRYFNVYGPGEAHKDDYSSFARKIYRAALTDQAITMFAGSDNIKRDFIYVQDAVDITLFFLDAKMSGIYNVGTGNARSFQDVWDAAKNALTADKVKIPNLIQPPIPNEILNRYQFYTCADTTKLGVAGWRGKFTTLETGMMQYWQVFTEES